ncbi:MAG: dihydrodipicolinate synthase family protein, partial [Pseudolysinimonas sp.]
MNRDDVDWAGYFPAVVTPFTESGELDTATLYALIEQYAERGMHGVVVNGTCGEWFSQTDAERQSVAETAVAAAGGRLRVLIGCTSNRAENVVRLGKGALAAGADGVLASPPPYIKLFPNEVVAWYEEISDLLRAPLVIYNWPHGTGIDIDSDLADRLA